MWLRTNALSRGFKRVDARRPRTARFQRRRGIAGLHRSGEVSEIKELSLDAPPSHVARSNRLEQGMPRESTPQGPIHEQE